MFSKSKRFEIKSAAIKSSSSITSAANTKKHVTIATICKTASSDTRNDSTSSSSQSINSSTEVFKTPTSTPLVLLAGKSKVVTRTLIKKSNTNPSISLSKPSSAIQNAATLCGLEKSKHGYPKDNYEIKLRELKTTMEKMEKKLKESNLTIINLKEQLTLSQTQEKLQILTLNKNSTIDIHNVEKLNSENEELSSKCSNLTDNVNSLEEEVKKLKEDIYVKQMEMVALEDLISIRDGLCRDLQNKLDLEESACKELTERLESVKDHHSLALQANESIRLEYKVELDALKVKHEDEHHGLVGKFTFEQETLKQKHKEYIETLEGEYRKQIEELNIAFAEKSKEKDELRVAKLTQLEERFREQIRLSEIQYEEENRCQQAHWKQQLDDCQKIAEDEVMRSELEIKRLTECLEASEFRSRLLTNNINSFSQANESYKEEIRQLTSKLNSNNGNKECDSLIVELREKLDEAQRGKRKYETALQVSRDALEVLGARLLRSDMDVESLNKQLKYLHSIKLDLETEVVNLKNDTNELTVERDEYKEALTNIINSKNMLDQAHHNIMTQNETLMDSLDQIENRACEEVNAVKNEFMESIGGVGTEILLQLAANQLTSLEERNLLLEEQAKESIAAISELSALRKENEDMLLTLSKQASLIDNLKRSLCEKESTPLSPLSKKQILKSSTPGKENRSQLLNVSPLRERNY